MKNRIVYCMLVIMMMTSLALAGGYEDCDYYRKNGRHNYVDDGYERYPTCSQEGIKWVKCLTCWYRGISAVPKTDHSYGEWTVIVNATENSAGVHSHSCTVCGAVDTAEFYPNRTVYHHRKADVIASMQEMLVQLGYLTSATGKYDSATEAAVKKIQRHANFPIDGIAWPQTMDYIYEQVALLENKPSAGVQNPVATPVASGGAETYSAPSVTQQAYCTQTNAMAGMLATVYCPTHQALLESCEIMLGFAQTDALKAEALRMCRLLLENELQQMYTQWQASVPETAKQIVLSHQAMSANYLNMQEITWKMQYGENDIRVMENAVDELKQQCAELCLLLGQNNKQ